uniref:Paraquat-inducible protein A n=1 Tax=Candidatus Kentrum sp. SD TaxID=2126332 RepID=A0A451BNT0_9GAMM|nr:MAG: Paraquat-inducible protein A [Candidatus Kentron sp. SD]VFK46988.1 MAG: Paraquat-inducible protein A [Candidatus Kentron sp. SD]VFK79946.1 MAG: Paraquat-inducible protein A [Candidatus Kentron sp. SD]
MNDRGEISARAAGLVACATCGKLHRMPREQSIRHRLRCARCGGALHSRKPHGIQRAWALLLTGMLLYLPANIYPIMVTRNLGRSGENTIISGIIALWNSGAHGIAGVIFVASVVIPITKSFVILYLLLNARGQSPLSRGQRARLYRLTEFIGPWSMVDVFVVAILVALVDMGGIASVMPGIAAAAFAAMVGITMLAAMAFDPRLLWDNEEKR